MQRLHLKKKKKTILIIVIILFSLFSTYFVSVLLNKETDNFTNKNQIIVLISMDGLGSNLINENTPFLFSLLDQQKVSYTLDMQTIEQSETMPSHVSMVTGLKQENHQFYLNSLSPDTPPIEEETIFDYAVENGYSFSTFLTKDKLIYLLGDKIGENIISKEKYSSELMREIDELIEPDNSKIFVFLHFRDIDSYGHTSGWNSSEQQVATRALDQNLESITEDIKREFQDYERYYIFTADHGGEGTQHSNGCEDCRKIPFIVLNENTNKSYRMIEPLENIYDTTCVVLTIMGDSRIRNLDCRIQK